MTHSERRSTLLLLAYWERLRGARPFPAEQEIDPAIIGDLWEDCFLIGARDAGNHEDYNFTHLGSRIRERYDGGILHDAETPEPAPNAFDLSSGFQEVLEQAQPILREGEFRNLKGSFIRYRQILLPLGQNGRVEAILGLMRFKMF